MGFACAGAKATNAPEEQGAVVAPVPGCVPRGDQTRSITIAMP